MSELDVQIQIRRQKRQRLVDAGVEPYPRRFDHDLEPAGVHARYSACDADELAVRPVRLRVPGRVRALRHHGGTVFIDLHDGTAKLQLMVRRRALAEASALVLETLDLGDYLGASGPLLRTRAGELTLAADELVLLAKALRPPPEKWHGLADVEARYRQRYLDLAANAEARRVFEVRSAIVTGLRRFFDARGFLEVETPMMQLIAGGATARPFVTHHNALDLDLYLRIAPELFLKRLLVGGLHRVYEINRNFRNEGISTQHNPEFTMLEFYWAYADWRDLMSLTEELLAELARSIVGTTALPWQGGTLDLTPGWPRLTVREGVMRFGGLSSEQLEDPVELAFVLRERGAVRPPAVAPGHPLFAAATRAEARELLTAVGGAADAAWGQLLMAVFEAVAEEHLHQPTFVCELPAAVSPLAKQSPADARFTERFELYIAGMEIANGFCELNDPDLQAERFREQIAAREAGDEEAHGFDEDYIRALEHGMPPAAGEGVGVDRLAMLFTDRQSIRDVILFPLLKPESAG